MFSKVIRAGQSFGPTCEYLCQDQTRARVLDAKGVRIHDYKLMAQDFECQRQMQPERGKAVFHTILSFQPGENPSDAQMVTLARKYLEGIGVTNTQYAVTRHTDKAHAHMHIIANWVNNDGKSIPNGWIGLKCKKVAQQLTKEYGLAPCLKKNLELTHRENLPPSDQRRYRIYEAIHDSLPRCRNLGELEKSLRQQGIDTRLRYDKDNREPIGISFRIENESFKGCKIDREYAIQGLQRTLALQRQQELKQEDNRQHRLSHRNSLHL